MVKVAEHHGFEDGYSPQPLAFLAAAAARTERIGLSTGILIAPLHKSVEIAEQAAVVDGISGSRLKLAFGAGYHRPEYDLYGVSINQRFKLIEQRVVEIRDLWASGDAPPAPERGELRSGSASAARAARNRRSVGDGPVHARRRQLAGVDALEHGGISIDRAGRRLAADGPER